jgi:hypothetical protein
MSLLHIPFRAPRDVVKLVADAAKKTATPKAHVMREALRIGVPEYIRRLRPGIAVEAAKK